MDRSSSDAIREYTLHDFIEKVDQLARWLWRDHKIRFRMKEAMLVSETFCGETGAVADGDGGNGAADEERDRSSSGESRAIIVTIVAELTQMFAQRKTSLVPRLLAQAQDKHYGTFKLAFMHHLHDLERKFDDSAKFRHNIVTLFSRKHESVTDCGIFLYRIVHHESQYAFVGAEPSDVSLPAPHALLTSTPAKLTAAYCYYRDRRQETASEEIVYVRVRDFVSYLFETYPGLVTDTFDGGEADEESPADGAFYPGHDASSTAPGTASLSLDFDGVIKKLASSLVTEWEQGGRSRFRTFTRILYLYYALGMNPREIAAEFDCSGQSITNYLTEAVATLKLRMEEIRIAETGANGEKGARSLDEEEKAVFLRSVLAFGKS